ncbi:MAG: sugar ABC transporter substrate-binding protein [Gammaproteobacteria bacterium]|nr:MAG: sugar ABC transporter substrate-binding protein [Gammaproteobacteria bacterium]
MEKIIQAMLFTGILLLSGCSENNSLSDQNKVIKLWVAPNVTQEAFWKIAIDKWNKSGLGLPVSFTTIPATGGAEEAILTALVSGNAPDISTNIFSGFAAQLANLGQLQELSSMNGYSQIIEHRKMASIMKDWGLNGKQYILPLYSNPVLIWWRSDILKDLGFEQVPQTYDEVYALSKKRAALGNKFGLQVTAGKEWRDRWFDYISFYYAEGNGLPYIKDREAQYDNDASLAVLTFIKTMFENRWTALDFDSDDPLTTGLVAGAVHGPWDISYYQKMFPEILKKIAIGPMIKSTKNRPQNKSKTSTFADSKGLVLFKSSQVKAEAFAFINWVFMNDELSILWLDKTGMPPARGDLTTNKMFNDFYSTHPLGKAYASYVDVAVPPAFIEETIDVQKVMNVEMIGPVKFGIKNVKEAAKDAVIRTNKLLGWAK